MRKISYSFALLIVLLVIACSNHLSPEKAIQKLGANPYYEIDGNQVYQKDLASYKPTEIAAITTYYNKDAVNRYGEKAIEGAVIIETKQFATIKFETFLKKNSKEYEKMLNETQIIDIQYILNDRILTENFEGTLASIDDKLLKEIIIIDQKELIEKYQIQNKKIGVVIKSKAPKNLYNAKKKF